MKNVQRFISISAQMIVGSGFLICAQATPIVNGSFESGNFTGWSTAGDVLVVDSSFGTVPTNGGFQALISNAPSGLGWPGDIIGTFSGNPSWEAIPILPNVALEVFLNLPSHSLAAFSMTLYDTLYGNPQAGFPFEGSAIKQSFTANQGDILSFNWDFLTNEYPGTFADFAFFVLDGTLGFLANPHVTGFSSSSTVFIHELGYHPFAMTLATSGTHTFGIGIVDTADDASVNSALLIDGFSVTSLPAPGSLLLLGMGLGGLAVVIRSFLATN